MNIKEKLFGKESKTWPYNSDYLCHCPVCKEKFSGPKRAPACWECVSQKTKDWWELRNTVQK